MCDECFGMGMVERKIEGCEVRGGGVNGGFGDEEGVIWVEDWGLFVVKMNQQLPFENDEGLI